MRKNTLIKLLAVLAMCFLICAAFVACGDNDEPAVEEAKVIVGVAFDAEGNLVISYNDNTTQKVALPAAATCEHLNIAEHTLVEHTAGANGKYLEVCDDCGYAWIKYEKRHDWVKYDEPKVVEPTCYSEGYTITHECACGATSEKTDIKAAVDHVWVNPVTSYNGNKCENGGATVYECKFGCGETKEVKIDAQPNTGIDGQHNVTAWAFNVPVEYNENKVVLTGTCEDCGKEVTYNAPALKNNGDVNETDYTVSLSTRTNCREAIIGTFTLKVDTTIVFADVVVEQAGVAHMLKNAAGELVFVYQANVADMHGATHEYSTSEYAGIKGFADKDIVSCTPILAYYRCEAENCNAVCDVMAYSEHSCANPIVDPADCENDGSKTYVCDVCGDTYKIETIPATDHAYKYSELYYSDAKQSYVVDVECTNANCGLNEVAYVPSNIDVEETEATCSKVGSLVVTYTVHNNVVKTYTKTTPKTGHKLNGKVMVARDEQNVVIYKWVEGCGIHEFDATVAGDADRAINANAPVVAYFICDDCGAIVDVYAQIGTGEEVALPKKND